MISTTLDLSASSTFCTILIFNAFLKRHIFLKYLLSVNVSDVSTYTDMDMSEHIVILQVKINIDSLQNAVK